MFAGYFDEGGHEYDPHFIMGGLALEVGNSDRFDSDWLSRLFHFTQKPEIHTCTHPIS